jgi:hypothetical protein
MVKSYIYMHHSLDNFRPDDVRTSMCRPETLQAIISKVGDHDPDVQRSTVRAVVALAQRGMSCLDRSYQWHDM